MSKSDPVVEVTGIGKRYGGVDAIRTADIRLRAGEIHALVGENGAGKSTLVKIISGVVQADSGTLEVGGQLTTFAGPVAAQRAGIAMVAQELSLFPDLTVRENLFPRAHPLRLGLLDGRAVDRAAAPVLDQLGLTVDMRARVGELPLAEQQLLEIARAMLARPRLLILDEPTSAQPRSAVERLEAVLRGLSADGLAVLYISHFLEEVMRMADRVTVMRDGATTVTGRPVRETDLDALVTAMIGEQPSRSPAPQGAASDHRRGSLVVDHVGVSGAVYPVSVRVAPGETVGVTGLQGAGHLTLLEVVCGRTAASSGEVVLPSGARPRSLRHAMKHGLGFLPSDRKRYGLMLDRTLWENVAATRWMGLGRGGAWQHNSALRRRCSSMLSRLRVRGSVDQLAGQLSGGNQQKVIFARLLDADPDVLVLDDPTRGVDVGARAEMHQIIRSFVAGGRPVLMTSTDLDELADLCDRVLVMQRQRLVATLSGAGLTQQGLAKAMNAGFVGTG